ncbi:class E sortase [Branchiibius sp. NY16-3462-2]|uniref:Class E sortase n=1 Tax=Branchiibius cervicis TaxID=908252 RepID=A0ABW2ATT7_9MICO|nr:class E sortase [Branchiibius sp. NY16-3462-2]KYH44812.1 hypothetical protein AZH51_12360 [Branchiibius sp. NY16-3462-2]
MIAWFRRNPLAAGLWSACAALLAISLTCGGVLVWQLWIGNAVAAQEHSDEVRALQQQWKSGRTAAPGNDPRVMAQPDAYGTPFAIMRVPRFGADWIQPIVQGANLDELAAGIGHAAGSAMPGQVGNFAVAGHRTTHDKPFNLIATLQAGDLITVETATDTYIYKVTSHEVVQPTDVAVFDPVPGKPGVKPTVAMLTMSSCHPEFSARERYVVHAVLVGSRTKTG